MDSRDALIFLTVTQGVIALGMAAVAVAVGGTRLWATRRLLAASFAGLGLFHLLSMLSFWMAGLGSTWMVERTVASGLSLAALVVHVACLGFALHLTVQQREVPRGTVRVLFAASAMIALALTLPGALSAEGATLRTALRIGLRSLLVALAYGGMAAMMARYRPPEGRSLGQGLVIASLGVLAGASALNAVAIFGGSRLEWAAGASVWLQVFGLVGLMALVIAMLVWVQERTQSIAEAQARSVDRLAHFDPDTGLPNRQGLLRRLGQGGGDDAPLTVMVVRLQRHAMLERTLGAAWMLDALQQLAAALRGTRQDPVLSLARVDADRIAIALGIDGALADAEAISRRRGVERAAQALRPPLSTTFGFAVRQHRESAETLLASACLAQEKAETGGARMLRYAPEQARSDAEEIELLSALYRALSDDELFLEVQGIFNATTLDIIGVEALVRWRHPTRGVLAPGQFLPVAERGGLMADLDLWVLDRACMMLKERHAIGLPALPVSVNLSAASLLDASLPISVAAILRRHDLDPALLEIEITESAAMNDLRRAAEVVDTLRAIGVRVALDDLGTGYSSLTHLRELRVDRLKIDRSFMTEGDRFGTAIVVAVGALGQALGTDVVAEGVETEAQLALCREHRIGGVQGWLLHRPSTDWPLRHDAAATPAPAGPPL